MPVELDVAAHPDRVAPDAEDGPGAAVIVAVSRSRRPFHSDAPDLEVDVDDVVVGDRDAREPVADRERADLAGRLEVPDDALARCRSRTVPKVPGGSALPSSVQAPGRVGPAVLR